MALITLDPARWDVPALRAGASVSMTFAVPLVLLARFVQSRDPESSVPLWLSVGAWAGFVLGAGCAAWMQQLDLPLKHGLVTAVATFALVQVVLVVLKLARGGDVDWFVVFFGVTMVAGAGLVGGIVGARLRAKGFQPTRMEQR